MRRLVLRRVHSAADGGFILLESIIAMAIITLIMSAVGAEFVNGMISTSQQRAEQGAVQLADSAVEQVRSLHPSDLLGGRDRASVTAQFSAAAAPVQPWLAQMDQAVDATAAAGSGATATIPTTGTPQKPGIVSYTVNDYLGWCYIPPTGSTSCVPKAAVGGAAWTAGVGCSTDGAPLCYLRTVVAVTWSSSRCGTSVCSYVTSTLVSAASDPTFKLNQPLPAAPIVLATSDQIVAVGDVVSLQLLVTNNTGVPPFTWALTTGSLPTNLALSPTGLISGTVGAPAGTQTVTVTVTVTDAFLRTATDTFTWTVEPPIALSPPGAQANTTADTVNLTLTASGGDGAPYTWSDPTGSLPPGLSVSSSGVVTGRPTTRGNYTVQLKIVDKSGVRFGTGTFTWTIAYPPIAVSNPGTQASTINTAITPTLQLSASGGSGNYVWSDSPRSLPAGLTISSSGLITGTPTATTSGAVTVTLTVTDPTAGLTKTVSFAWSVFARPTVSSPGNQTVSVGTPVSFGLSTTCPNTPCAYTIANGPGGLSISSLGIVNGTVSGSPQTYPNVSVTVVDGAGASATSGTFSLIVNPAPSITSPGNQTALRNAPDTLDMSALTTGGTGGYSYFANNLPSWLTLNSGTGMISGTAPNANSTTSNITVTVVDSTGATAVSAPFTWNVTNLANSFGDQTTYKSTAVSTDLDTFTTGGTGPFTYSASGLPSWLTLNPNNGVISGTAPNVAANSTTKTSGITITVTDSVGAVITISPFNWYVTDLKWSTIPGQTTSKGTTFTAANGLKLTNYDTGGSTPWTYTAVNLPTGLSLNSSGVVIGTANTRATWTVTVTSTDSVGATVTTTFSWKVQ